MVKKSEKIEIRLSHADKTNLAELAQKEGRTISELVRRIIQRYVEFNIPSQALKFPIAKILAVGLVSFAAGALLVYFSAEMKKPKQPKQYWLETNIDGMRMHIALPMEDDFSTELAMPNKDGNIQIKVKLFKDVQDLKFLSMDFCRTIKDTCILFANPVLLINQENRSELSFSSKSGEFIIINIGPR